MSLIPFLFEDFHPFRPSRIMDQQFGVGLHPEDLMMPFNIPQAATSHRRSPFGYYRPWRSISANKDTGSTVSLDKDKFHVNLDVQHFLPNEITVKVTGKNTITVEGKHDEKQDEHGHISRQFVRRYVLPEGHDIEKVVSNLSSDGVLSITAPRAGTEAIEERAVPILQTGTPLRTLEPKKEESVAEK